MYRKISKSDFYHLMIKGNNSRYIFKNNYDKNYYLKSLFKISKEEKTPMVAWCIMDNHIHILIKIKHENFQRFLKRLNIRYSLYYRKKYKVTGHLFQKTKDLAIESDADLINNLRYIHNNPLEAKIINSPEEYKFSSYRYYLNNNLTSQMREIKNMIASNNDDFIEFHKWNLPKTKD